MYVMYSVHYTYMVSSRYQVQSCIYPIRSTHVIICMYCTMYTIHGWYTLPGADLYFQVYTRVNIFLLHCVQYTSLLV